MCTSDKDQENGAAQGTETKNTGVSVIEILIEKLISCYLLFYNRYISSVKFNSIQKNEILSTFPLFKGS